MKDNFFFCGKVGHSGAADVEAIDKNKKNFKTTKQNISITSSNNRPY